jgi:hypothetical protein
MEACVKRPNMDRAMFERNWGPRIRPADALRYE